MRYIINELGIEYKVNPLKNLHFSTFLAVGVSACLVLLPKGPRGLGSGGYLLWPLFGTSNQLLAAISLLIVTIWHKRQERPIIYTLAPLIFLLFMTLWAMIEQVFFQWSGFGETDNNLLLFGFGAVIMVFTIWIIVEALVLFRRESIEDVHTIHENGSDGNKLT